jgi:dTDP-4-amino-4,6-dideoxygalactose transaminase
MIKFLDLGKQYQSIKAEIDTAMAEVIADTAFVGGKYVKRFEMEFAHFQNAEHCVAVGNGTDALEIAIESLELPPGSEVAVPANSFIASSEAVSRAGHKVLFVDCDPDNYTLSLTDLKAKLTPQTKAIMPVHLYGHACDMDAIMDIARESGLRVIEDCAQAHGCEYKNRRVGSIGDIAAFSFYPGKNLGAYGDGGAILTNDESLAVRARMIANHGRIEKYNHEFEGRNSRMDGLQGAILSTKLRHLEGWLEARRSVAASYLAGLADCGDLVLPLIESWTHHVYHLFVIRTGYRDDLQGYLKEAGVQTGVHYPIALTKLKAYRRYGLATADLVANAYDSTLLSLPMGEHLSSAEVDKVVMRIRSFYD